MDRHRSTTPAITTGRGRSAIRRKRWLAAARLAVVLASLASAGIVAAFDLDDVTAKARKLAGEPFQDSKVLIPEWLKAITYDQWRDIRLRPEHALWRQPPSSFQVQFFHPGLYYERTVAVNVVDAKGSRALRFSPSQFDYGKNEFASRVPQDLGYAGLRLHAPFKTTKYYDEVAVFLGASYFRCVGKHEGFGLSARGLAIDTALPTGEEFPYFREFWLLTPTHRTKDATFYALLDSPSLTGAYSFVIRPGEQTVVRVQARLFLRREPQKIGIAPLTSMFFHGENTARFFDDFRPEVHDSDGLLVHHGSGECLWRPLDNPRALQVSRFRMPALQGFGLVQRDRDFSSYQDLETRAELRPSAWVSPEGDWGSGSIELVEIPTKSDTNDNIVAYWVPDRQPKQGGPFDFAYTLSWFGDDPARSPRGRTVATRRDSGNKENAQRFIVDFAGKTLAAIPADQVVRGSVTVAGEDSAVRLLDQQVVKNTVTGGWRLTFQMRPQHKDPIELRAFLDQGTRTLTETWSYLLVP